MISACLFLGSGQGRSEMADGWRLGMEKCCAVCQFCMFPRGESVTGLDGESVGQDHRAKCPSPSFVVVSGPALSLQRFPQGPGPSLIILWEQYRDAQNASLSSEDVNRMLYTP